jgi:2,4-dienoyl-CoA reductase (NADPH2)
MKNVRMVGGVSYDSIDDHGLTISFGENHENTELIVAENVIICAGQVPERTIADALIQLKVAYHLIGGADIAVELDAKRAIDQGSRIAASI